MHFQNVFLQNVHEMIVLFNLQSESKDEAADAYIEAAKNYKKVNTNGLSPFYL